MNKDVGYIEFGVAREEAGGMGELPGTAIRGDKNGGGDKGGIRASGVSPPLGGEKLRPPPGADNPRTLRHWS